MVRQSEGGRSWPIANMFTDRDRRLQTGAWAIVPVKELSEAKSRLSPLFPQDIRKRLTLAMLDDVLCALREVEALSRILVVSRDPDAAAAASRQGAETVSEPLHSDQNGALNFAANIARREGAETILVMPADVPLAEAGDVAGLLKQHGVSPAMTIVPDRHGSGTNALVCSPPDLLPFNFGEGSFLAHVKNAEARGVRPSISHRPSLALDIDTPEDISLLKNSTADAGTVRYLRSLDKSALRAGG